MRRRCVLLALVVAAGAVAARPDRPVRRAIIDEGPTASVPSAYHPVEPLRVLDTRDGLGGVTTLPAGASATLDLSAVLPAATTAVVLTATVTETRAAGYLTIWPTGNERPRVSSLNATRRGATVSNLVTVAIGPGRSLSLFSQSGTDVVLDLAGYYAATSVPAAGRFVPAQARAVDTRDDDDLVHPGAVRPGETLRIDLTGHIVWGASAVALNVTVVDAPAGYWTLWPAGAARPLASNVNVDGGRPVTATAAIVGLRDGAVELYAQTGGHVVIDVLGSYTGPSSTPGVDGRFVALSPTRILDTRTSGTAPPTPGSAPVADATALLAAAGLDPSDVAAIVGNTTIADAAAPGYVTVSPAGLVRPLLSNLNATARGDVVANHTIAPVSATGVTLYTQSGTQLVLDVNGVFLGPPSVRLTSPAGDPPTTGAHAFLAHRRDGYPMRWDPCTPVRYRTNLERAPAGTAEAVRDALTTVSAGTGLTFVNTGSTTDVTEDGPESGSYDLLIAFTSRARRPDLFSGPSAFGGFTSDRAGWVIAGYVFVDGATVTPAAVRPVLIHELAHAVGLAHVTDRHQVLHPVITERAAYGDGDLEGLWWVGAAQGCR